MMSDNEKECTLSCIRMGGKFVLFDPNTKAVYQLDDQKRPVGFAGERVTVTGSLDTSTKTIKVENIQATSR